TDGDLPDASESAHEQQVGDVDARDQQQQGSRGGKDEQRRSGVADDESRECIDDAAQGARPWRSSGTSEVRGELVARGLRSRAGGESREEIDVRVDRGWCGLGYGGGGYGRSMAEL